jgi:hypothetical protein
MMARAAHAYSRRERAAALDAGQRRQPTAACSNLQPSSGLICGGATSTIIVRSSFAAV